MFIFAKYGVLHLCKINEESFYEDFTDILNDEYTKCANDIYIKLSKDGFNILYKDSIKDKCDGLRDILKEYLINLAYNTSCIIDYEFISKLDDEIQKMKGGSNLFFDIEINRINEDEFFKRLKDES